MRTIFADNPNNTFLIGYQGENNAVQVKFNVKTFRKQFGSDGDFHLTHRRHGDASFYPCEVSENDGWVDWVVNSADNARDGLGDCELLLIVGDETVAKSVYHTQTLKANHDAEGPTPEPSEPWMAEALQAKEAAIRAAEEAEESAKDIEDLTVSSHQLPVGETEPTVDKTRTEDGYNLDFGFPRGGQGGTAYHDDLLNRDLPDQHPIDAIEGLRDELDEITESVPTELADLEGDATHRLVTDAEKSTWDAKQDAISDLEDIREGAALGATAVRPEAGKGLFSGSYNDLSNKPTIPTVPTNVSAFNNDAGYLTEHQSLFAYRTASEQEEIDNTKQTKAITDSAGYYTTNTVEGALAEIGGKLDGLENALDAINDGLEGLL